MILKYKPLSFSTTLRNPERIGEFLSIMKNFDNQLLDENLCYKIYIKFIEEKVVYPQKAIKENGWEDKYDKFDFTKKELKKILFDYDSSHKEAGFPKGKPSRVDTYLRLIKELGLMYYDFNCTIKLTKSGIKYADAYEKNDLFEMQKIFMNALINFQTNTPLRANKSQNRPVSLLFNVIHLLNIKVGTPYVKKDELPLLICSKDNDYNRIVNKIIQYRKYKDIENKKEAIYTYILSEYKETETYIKYDRVFIESVDDYIRKFRFAGIIDLKGIDIIKINSMFDIVAEKIRNLNDDFIEEKNEYEFIKKISEENDFLLKIFSCVKTDSKVSTEEWIQKFCENSIDIDKEIIKLTKTNSKKETLPELETLAPSLLLEFLYVLKIQKEFPGIKVIGNYKSNDEGVPIFHAPGGYPDIIIEAEEGNNSIVEVTLLGGRNQLAQELIPIARHLEDYKVKNQGAFCWYISRVIHPDLIRYSKFVKSDEDLDIYLSNIPQSIDQINSSKNNYYKLIKKLPL